ncbi:MAG: hypothetical protein M1825_003685 [Sarcosagium campestre]|nr:MAG: hypothetical protein M1825_003685 [Sarcosagium campestre]
MSHMSINHLARQASDSASSVDITGAQMVAVMKLSAFCWNVHDGRLPQQDLSDFQKSRALTGMPGLLDFAAYVLFFPSLFAGPSFDFVEYRRWIDTSMFELPAGVDATKRAPTRKRRKIPRSGTPATIRLIVGLFWIFAYLKFSVWYSADLLLEDRYMDYSLIRRVWILHMFGFSARMKYYGVWALTEGACILSGLGYKGVDQKTGAVNWRRLQNVNPVGVETAQNSRAYLEHWNINTNHWLRNYIYLRVTPKGKKPGFRASMATFVTSAFWHGFYPGYYLAFILASFIQTIAKNFRRYVRPFFLTVSGTPTPYKKYYDALSYVATQAAFSFTVAPFILLTLPASLKVWARVYLYCPIGIVLSIAFFASPAKGYLIAKLKRRGAARVDAAADNSQKMQRVQSQDSIRPPALGLPNDPGRDLDEAVREVMAEVELRRRKGSTVTKDEVVNEFKNKMGL